MSIPVLLTSNLLLILAHQKSVKFLINRATLRNNDLNCENCQALHII